jgi:hypothetical protein
MNLSLILRRSRREWRQLGILTVALCLVTAFFSLGPLYVRAAVQSGLKYELDAIQRSKLNLTLVNPGAWEPSTWDQIATDLGPLVSGLTRLSRNATAAPSFQYIYGEPTWDFSGRTPFSYYVFAFSTLRDEFKLVAGRWPERLQPPNTLARTARDEQEQLDKGLGMYSTGDVEAVITEPVATFAGFEVGTRVVIGQRAEQRVVLNIVGIVEPADPTAPFFQSADVKLALQGELGDFSVTGAQSFFPSVIVPEGAYTDWIVNGTALIGNPNQTFIWEVRLNPSAVNADNLTSYRERLTVLANQLTAQYQGLFVFNPLLKLLNTYADLVSKTEGPIVWLSGAVLIMMLYHLVTTVNLVLEQQMGEWASLSSRGASTWQLVVLQLVTMLLLGVVGFIIGPFLAFLILVLLSALGPLGASSGGVVPILGIPASSFTLSLIAAVAAVLMLTLPAIPAARRSLAQFKQMAARPPARPAWARFFLDFLLILLGVGFIVRLLFYVEGDAQQTVALLASNPGALIQLIIDSANRAGGLSDPLNLVGPALLLTGVALLWLRLFPMLMRLIGRLTGRNNGLTAPLAVWNVEREPGHYAQLVLLLIGTLALGTAALALGATRDQGAWAAARLETGSSVRVDVAGAGTAESPAWTSVPGVTGATAVLYAPTTQTPGRIPAWVVGVDPDAMAATIPEAREAVTPLIGQTVNMVKGIAIPDDATQLSIDVFTPSRMPDSRLVSPDGILVWVTIADLTGNLTRLPLTAPAFALDQWMTYSADISALRGAGELVVSRIEFSPQVAVVPSTANVVFLDSLQSLSAAGTATMLNNFDASREGWEIATNVRVFDAGLANDIGAPGRTALRFVYQANRIASDPVIDPNATSGDPAMVGPNQPLPTPVMPQASTQTFEAVLLRAVGDEVIPAVISARMAKDLGEAARRERLPLEVGMTVQHTLTMPGGNVKVNFKIVGIIRSFPSFEERQHVILFDRRTALQLINTQVAAEGRYRGANQFWLETANRQPAADLDAALRAAATPAVSVAGISFAWENYNVLLREPLPSALAGMLYTGFWVSLVLSLLDFAFYLVVTARRRSLGFAVLRSLGWNANNIWVLLVAEQAALVIPALLVGIGLGAVLGYVILPFLALVGGQTLQMPLLGVVALVIVLLLGFGTLSLGAARWLRRLNVNQVLRLGEE